MLSGSKGVTPRSLNFLQKRGKVKFLFDMDGTLTARETLPMIAAHFGVQAPVADATIAAVTGREPFDQSLRQRVAALGHLPVDEVSRLVTTVPLHRLIVDFVNSHRDQCAIVTSNLDCWCDALMRKMGCEAFCSRAQITGNHVIGITELLHKEDVVDAYKADSRPCCHVSCRCCGCCGLPPGYACRQPCCGGRSHLHDREGTLCRS